MIQKMQTVNCQVSGSKETSNGVHLQNGWILAKRSEMTHVIIEDEPENNDVIFSGQNQEEIIT